MTETRTLQRRGLGGVWRWSRRWALFGTLLLLLGMLAAPSVAGAAAAVKCTPNNAPVGTMINVGVTGLPTNQLVTLTSTGPDGLVAKSDHTSDATGALSVNYDTTGDAVGAYRVQVLDATGAVLAQGAYTLTAATPGSMPSAGGGYAAGAQANYAPQAIGLAVGTLALLAACGYLVRRRRAA